MAARNYAFFIICFVVSLCISSVSSRRDRNSIKGIFRSRRETCVDGTYTVDGQTCCLCPAGQWVKANCSKNPNDGQCERCESGTYNSVANFQETCQPCTSCAQPNANLEEDEPCTAVRNTKCRCKDGYFCSSKECTICHTCSTCGIGGIKEACTPTSDTVCKGAAGAIVGIVFGVLLAAALLLFVVGAVWRTTRGHHVFPWIKQKKREGENQGGPHVAIPLLQDDADIRPLLPDIANELGWKDMKNIAIRTGVANAFIESCEIDNQNNAEERTLQLLMRWAEKEGKEAPRKLIQTLEKMNKKGKAEKISDILLNTNSTSSNN